MKLILAEDIKAGEWDHIDPKYKEKGPVIAPLNCDNHGKILDEALRLFQIGRSSQPQNHGASLCGVIYNLLGFCAAHHIDVEAQLINLITQNND